MQHLPTGHNALYRLIAQCLASLTPRQWRALIVTASWTLAVLYVAWKFRHAF